MSGIYRAPDPPIGPDRQSDAYPLTDAAEVAALRREYPQRYRIRIPLGVLLQLGPEQFATHEEYEAARELDEWGCNPFEEE